MVDYTQDCLENLILTDVVLKNLERTYSDNLKLNTTNLNLPNKLLSDNLKFSDGDIELISKLLTDSIKLTGAFSKAWVLARTYSDTLDLTDTKKFSTIKKISNTLKVSDDNDNLKDLVLTETIKLVNNPPVCPVVLLNTELSTRNRWAEFSGTLQQVINLLDTKGIPENKVKGMAFTSAGRITVLVNKY